MKVSNYAVAAVLVIFFLVSPAMAGEGHGAGESGGKQIKNHAKAGHGDMTGHHDTMMDHMTMMHDNMQMMKGMIGIVKDLNHRPTLAQSERLVGMMKRMDKMMVKMLKMHDEMKKKDDMNAGKGMKMNPCSKMHK